LADIFEDLGIPRRASFQLRHVQGAIKGTIKGTK